MIVALLLTASAASAAAPAPVPAATEIPAPRIERVAAPEIDRSKIRWGRLADFHPDRGDLVGTVRSKDVYLEIPAYQTIVKEGIEKGSARWNQLMKEATSLFKKALRQVAVGQNFVLIVEDGGITGYPTTDATQAIVDAL